MPTIEVDKREIMAEMPGGRRKETLDTLMKKRTGQTAFTPDEFVDTLDHLSQGYDPATQPGGIKFYKKAQGTGRPQYELLGHGEMRLLVARLRTDYGKHLSRTGGHDAAETQFTQSMQAMENLAAATDAAGTHLVKNIPGDDQNRDILHRYMAENSRQHALARARNPGKSLADCMQAIEKSNNAAGQIVNTSDRVMEQADNQNTLGVIHFANNDHARAESILEAARGQVDAHRSAGGHLDFEAENNYTKILGNLAAAKSMLGKDDEALNTIREAMRREDVKTEDKDKSINVFLNGAFILAKSHHANDQAGYDGNARDALATTENIIRAQVAEGIITAGSPEYRDIQDRLAERSMFLSNSGQQVQPTVDDRRREVLSGTVSLSTVQAAGGGQQPAGGAGGGQPRAGQQQARPTQSRAHMEVSPMVDVLLAQTSSWSNMNNDEQDTMKKAVTDYAAAVWGRGLHDDIRKALLNTADSEIRKLRAGENRRLEGAQTGVGDYNNVRVEVFTWSALIDIARGDITKGQENFSRADDALKGQLEPLGMIVIPEKQMEYANLLGARALLQAKNGKIRKAADTAEVLASGMQADDNKVGEFRARMIQASVQDTLAGEKKFRFGSGKIRQYRGNANKAMMQALQVTTERHTPAGGTETWVIQDDQTREALNRFAEVDVLARADKVAADRGVVEAKSLYDSLIEHSFNTNNYTPDKSSHEKLERTRNYQHVIGQEMRAARGKGDYYTLHQLQRTNTDLNSFMGWDAASGTPQPDVFRDVKTSGPGSVEYNAAIGSRTPQESLEQLGLAANSVLGNPPPTPRTSWSMNQSHDAMKDVVLGNHLDGNFRNQMLVYEYSERLLRYMESAEGVKKIGVGDRVNMKRDLRDMLEILKNQDGIDEDFRIENGRTIKDLKDACV